MKRSLLIGLIFLIFFILITSKIEARSGCCSHHGGVCGCHCCDGTPLSAKCAPYYPQCNGSNTTNQIQEQKPVYNPPTNTPIPLPTWTPIPTKTPIPTNTPTPTLTNTPTPTLTPKPTKQTMKKTNKNKKINKKTNTTKSFWQWIFGK